MLHVFIGLVEVVEAVEVVGGGGGGGGGWRCGVVDPRAVALVSHGLFYKLLEYRLYDGPENERRTRDDAHGGTPCTHMLIHASISYHRKSSVFCIPFPNRCASP